MSISDTEIARMYRDGMGMNAIAERAEIGYATVWRALHRQDVPIRKPNAPLDEKAIAEFWLRNNRNTSKTAKEFTTTRHSIRRALIRAGVYEPTPDYPAKDSLSPIHRTRDPEFRTQVLKLLEQGETKQEIARQLKTTEESIRYVMYLKQKHITPEAEPCPTPSSSTIESEPLTDLIPSDSLPTSEDQSI